MSATGNIFNIQRFSVHDGPGIRTTVFMQGCALNCWWCHNPESRSFDFKPEHGEIKTQSYNLDILIQELLKDESFYDESGGGVSFSGGEPLAQFNFLKNALQLCHKNGIHTVVDTSGYTLRSKISEILPFTDLFLFDLKLIDPKKHLKYVGISNQEIIRNLDFLLRKKADVWIRIPIIPEITDTKNNLEQIAHFLKEHNFNHLINLLPYHHIAKAKYARLSIPYLMNGTKEPGNQYMKSIANYFKSFGFSVKIGG